MGFDPDTMGIEDQCIPGNSGSLMVALAENKDIESKSELVETEKERLMVRDTDSGKKIKEDIEALKMLLRAYREGELE